ncbi:MAG: hypothetical protein C5B60_07225 [Chloroflexi bacterium]|nr:MAG: hypothetical protein C5B60_07225 [Chloroflexota bacterium]
MKEDLSGTLFHFVCSSCLKRSQSNGNSLPDVIADEHHLLQHKAVVERQRKERHDEGPEDQSRPPGRQPPGSEVSNQHRNQKDENGFFLPTSWQPIDEL